LRGDRRRQTQPTPQAAKLPSAAEAQRSLAAVLRSLLKTTNQCRDALSSGQLDAAAAAAAERDRLITELSELLAADADATGEHAGVQVGHPELVALADAAARADAACLAALQEQLAWHKQALTRIAENKHARRAYGASRTGYPRFVSQSR
jgi:hypothetical protein